MMEQFARMSMPLSKTCSRCKELKPISRFHKDKGHLDGLRSRCSDCRMEYQRIYRNTQSGEEAHRRYDYSIKGLNRTKKWKHSAKYKLWLDNNPHYDKERYHRIQDEAVCYMKIGDFYPGFRLLKALEGAEIVEIKGG